MNHSPEQTLQDCFERIYASDLTFQPGCWELCGDAHCCHFSRYKANFSLIGNRPGQTLYLLPGELEFMKAKDLLSEFPAHTVTEHEFEVSESLTLHWHSLDFETDECPCPHRLRPTICRLYPLMPAFTADGSVRDFERLAIYEDLQCETGQDSICELKSVPFSQLPDLMRIIEALRSNRTLLAASIAYLTTKRHVLRRVREKIESAPNLEPFAAFEALVIRRKAIDLEQLKAEIAGDLGTPQP